MAHTRNPERSPRSGVERNLQVIQWLSRVHDSGSRCFPGTREPRISGGGGGGLVIFIIALRVHTAELVDRLLDSRPEGPHEKRVGGATPKNAQASKNSKIV